MAKVTNITCDNCNKVLYGKDKAAFIKDPNISIKGQVILQKVDEETGFSYPVYITRSPTEDLSFCDLVCFQEYVDMREKGYEDHRKNSLREEATLEELDRIKKK